MAKLLYQGHGSYRITANDGRVIYVDPYAGDTSKTEQMESFAVKDLNYALLPCDGIFNMGLKESTQCAEMIRAQHTDTYEALEQRGFFESKKVTYIE